ncbi:hypothetical protein [Cupriavidus sp. SHE]|uniref:hypothetical protein n=1 Tax=Cupriavidus sp. SHE TaxID=1539143 RepID=UPI0012E02AAB|nr:hypothetical protein [Cupriavidus sp. SHE]
MLTYNTESTAFSEYPKEKPRLCAGFFFFISAQWAVVGSGGQWCAAVRWKDPRVILQWGTGFPSESESVNFGAQEFRSQAGPSTSNDGGYAHILRGWLGVRANGRSVRSRPHPLPSSIALVPPIFREMYLCYVA